MYQPRQAGYQCTGNGRKGKSETLVGPLETEAMKFVMSVWADAQCLAKAFPVCFQFNHCKSAS